jgi:hypothetical protein
MQIVCPTCDRPVPATDLNIDRLVARCVGCNALFDVSAQLPVPPPVLHRRAPVARPASIRLIAAPGVPVALDGDPYRMGRTPVTTDVTLIRRWFSSQYVLLAIFCVFWDGILLTSIMNGNFAVFMVLHLLAGVAVTYVTLAGFVNRTTVTVRGGTLSVTHGPLPWSGNVRLSSADIEHIYSRERAVRPTEDGVRARAYDVIATLKAGGSHRLLRTLSDPDEAIFVEQTLKAHLGIPDLAVVGAFAPERF